MCVVWFVNGAIDVNADLVDDVHQRTLQRRKKLLSGHLNVANQHCINIAHIRKEQMEIHQMLSIFIEHDSAKI